MNKEVEMKHDNRTKSVKKLIIFVLAVCIFNCIIFISGCISDSKHIEAEIFALKEKNQLIDKNIANVVSLYSNLNLSYEDVTKTNDTIKAIKKDINELKKKLNIINSNGENIIDYDNSIFDKYEEILYELKDWEKDLTDIKNDDISKSYIVTVSSMYRIKI